MLYLPLSWWFIHVFDVQCNIGLHLNNIIRYDVSINQASIDIILDVIWWVSLRLTPLSIYVFLRTWLKAETKSKTESRIEWFNFIEKLYFITVDLFYRYNSDNNKNFAFINCLQQCPQGLTGKKDITPCA